MAAFCIPPHLAKEMKEAARTGAITMEKLFSMDSKDRRELFGKYVGQEMAKEVNAGFEKAMASDQQTAIANWVKSTFNSGEKKKPQYQDVLKKINDLQDRGLLTPENEKAFLEDLVAEKLGVTVTTEEATHISKLTEGIKSHAEEKGAQGGHTFDTHSEKYYKSLHEMDNYIKSLNPTHNLRVFTSTIGRGVMLLSVKSPLLNVASNSIVGFITTAERRIQQRKFNGFNSDYAQAYRKFAVNVYKNTGYDLSRFQSFGEEHKVRGEGLTHTQGKGAVRAVGRFVEDKAFNKLQGLPDVMFSSFHFVDSANLSSSVVALREGLKGEAAKGRALEVLKDAFKEAPETKEGQFVRAQAEADALYATFTQTSVASKVALGMRELVNTATGDLRLGDVTDPFVKTPANVIAAGLDYAGVTVTAKMGLGIIKTLDQIVNKKGFDRENFAEVNKYMIKAGFGLGFAFTISQLIQPQDFIGQYPTTPGEQKLFDTRNGVANSINVGGHWVSLDYLSIFGAPLLGFLYAKKYGQGGILNATYNYAQGVKTSVQNLPGISEMLQAIQYIQQAPSQKETATQAGFNAAKAFLGGLESRIVPQIFNDIGNMTDPYQRQTDKNSVYAKIQAQLPFVREGLPIQKDIFGTEEKTEPWLSTLLLGGRVKTAQESDLINELVRLDLQGELPSVSDVSTASTRMQELKTQIGDKEFTKAMDYFGKNLKTNMLETIHSDDYKNADSALAQKKLIDKTKTSTLKDTLDEYGYEKPDTNP